MKNKIVVSTDKMKISIESSKPDNVKDVINIEQMKQLVKIFNNFCKTTTEKGTTIGDLEQALDFKLGDKTKEMLIEIGSIRVRDFYLPTNSDLIKLTNEWRNTVAKDSHKDKLMVIESDNGDYTLVDGRDMIYVYDHKTKKTVCYDEDVVTHITKHIMSKIVGDKYEY